MMTIRRSLQFQILILLFLSLATCLQGQEKDFQSWWKIEFDKRITGKLDLSLDLQQHLKNNSLEYDKSHFTLGASYDPADFLRIAGGTRMVIVKDDEQEFHTRYRIHLDGIGSYELRGFDLSLRTRIQYGFDEYLSLRYFTLNELVNRNRLKVVRHIFGTRFDWFASVESRHGSGNDSRWITYTMRYSAGMRFSLNFTSRFSLRYFLEDEFNVANPRQLHVLMLEYSYRF